MNKQNLNQTLNQTRLYAIIQHDGSIDYFEIDYTSVESLDLTNSRLISNIPYSVDQTKLFKSEVKSKLKLGYTDMISSSEFEDMTILDWILFLDQSIEIE